MLALLAERPATLGAGRLVCVDGPAGSGKTTLAAALAAAYEATDGGPATVVHTDDLLDGWGGLPDLPARLDPLLDPLAEGRAGRYRRYDWYAARFDGWVTVEPAPLLVVEGVGSGARRHGGRCTLLVWVEADDDLRFARGLARDGEAARPHWEQWMRDERAHFVDQDTAARADVVVWTDDRAQR